MIGGCKLFDRLGGDPAATFRGEDTAAVDGDELRIDRLGV